MRLVSKIMASISFLITYTTGSSFLKLKRSKLFESNANSRQLMILRAF